MSFTTSSLSIRIGAWIAGRDGVEHGDVLLDRKRVYILPTRAGLTFGAAILVMLIGSINYGLQLGYLLTFLVASMAIVGMYHTHRNLARVLVRGLRAENVFAGDVAGFTLMMTNPTPEARHAISFAFVVGRRRRSDYNDGIERPLPGAGADLPARGQRQITLALPTRRRGRHPCPRIRIETHFPFGLWTAWAYFTPPLDAIVYPIAEVDAPPLPAGTGGSGESIGVTLGGDEFAGVRPYQSGDPQKLIAWRLAARSDDLSVKTYDAASGGEVVLDWQTMQGSADAEQRLSRLTRWVLMADGAHVRYGLRIPGATIELGSGAAHRERCLTALALAPV